MRIRESQDGFGLVGLLWDGINRMGGICDGMECLDYHLQP